MMHAYMAKSFWLFYLLLLILSRADSRKLKWVSQEGSVAAAERTTQGSDVEEVGCDGVRNGCAAGRWMDEIHTDYIYTQGGGVVESLDWSKYEQILITPQLFDEMHLHSIFRTPSLSTISTTRLTPPPPSKLLHCTTTILAVSDDELESRGFHLRRTAEGLDLEALNTVFTRVGFPRRDPARVRLALKHTQAVVWLEDRRSGKPVAFARATGDGVFNAVVWDVVVDPSFQGIGLGRAVMERLVADLVADGVSNIALYAEPRVIGFYRPLGFAADPDGIKGMVYVRKKKSG